MIGYVMKQNSKNKKANFIKTLFETKKDPLQYLSIVAEATLKNKLKEGTDPSKAIFELKEELNNTFNEFKDIISNHIEKHFTFFFWF